MVVGWVSLLLSSLVVVMGLFDITSLDKLDDDEAVVSTLTGVSVIRSDGGGSGGGGG